MIILKFKTEADLTAAVKAVDEGLKSFQSQRFEYNYQPELLTLSVTENNAPVITAWLKQKGIEKYHLSRGYGKLADIIRTAANLIADQKPSIFEQTIYRLPTEEELKEVDSFNLTDNQVFDGFFYTIVGRGILSQENIDLIKASAETLCKMFPGKYVKLIGLVEALVPHRFASSSPCRNLRVYTADEGFCTTGCSHVLDPDSGSHSDVRKGGLCPFSPDDWDNAKTMCSCYR